MNDLNTINRLNAEAVTSQLGSSIPLLQAQGKYVVAEYAGLHILSFETFSGEGAKDRAEAKLFELNSKADSTSGRLFAPDAGPQEAKLVDEQSAA